MCAFCSVHSEKGVICRHVFVKWVLSLKCEWMLNLSIQGLGSLQIEVWLLGGVADLEGKEFWYTTTAQDLIKRLGIEPLVKPLTQKTDTEADETQQRAVVNDECPKCRHPQLEYYTRQLRSADEGQTVFYECPNCRYKFSQNM
eukprot:c25218_g1_i1 orf=89-517(+)